MTRIWPVRLKMRCIVQQKDPPLCQRCLKGGFECEFQAWQKRGKKPKYVPSRRASETDSPLPETLSTPVHTRPHHRAISEANSKKKARFESDGEPSHSPFKASPSLPRSSILPTEPRHGPPTIVSPTRAPRHIQFSPSSPPKSTLDLLGLYAETSRDLVQEGRLHAPPPGPFPFPAAASPFDSPRLASTDAEVAAFVRDWFSESVTSLRGLSDPQSCGLLTEEHVREIWSHFFKYNNYVFVLLDPVSLPRHSFEELAKGLHTRSRF
jgi:hypothetical protein